MIELIALVGGIALGYFIARDNSDERAAAAYKAGYLDGYNEARRKEPWAK